LVIESHRPTDNQDSQTQAFKQVGN